MCISTTTDITRHPLAVAVEQNSLPCARIILRCFPDITSLVNKEMTRLSPLLKSILVLLDPELFQNLFEKDDEESFKWFCSFLHLGHEEHVQDPKEKKKEPKNKMADMGESLYALFALGVSIHKEKKKCQTADVYSKQCLTYEREANGSYDRALAMKMLQSSGLDNDLAKKIDELWGYTLDDSNKKQSHDMSHLPEEGLSNLIESLPTSTVQLAHSLNAYVKYNALMVPQ